MRARLPTPLVLVAFVAIGWLASVAILTCVSTVNHGHWPALSGAELDSAFAGPFVVQQVEDGQTYFLVWVDRGAPFAPDFRVTWTRDLAEATRYNVRDVASADAGHWGGNVLSAREAAG